MDLPAELCAPMCTVPLPLLDLSGEEARLAQSLFQNLQQLEQQSNNLSAALLLFDHSLGIPINMLRPRHSAVVLWVFMAAREGAMSLNNFFKALSNVASLSGRIATIAPLIDLQAVKRVKQDFRARFERVERLRDSVAHPELYANPDVDMTGPGIFDGPGPRFGDGERIPGSLHNRTYFATIEGLTVKYELSAVTALALVDYTKRVFAAFARIRTEGPFPQREED